MKRTLKITSGLLASTILLSGYNGEKVTVATEIAKVNVETGNQNVKAQLTEKDGKNYVVVTATKDVNNLSVRAKASNNQTFVFKQASLKAGESVSFELEIVAEQAEKQKQLPKTSVVRETLKLNGMIKGYSVEATISYDVDKPEVEQPKKLEENKSTPEIAKPSNEAAQGEDVAPKAPVSEEPKSEETNNAVVNNENGEQAEEPKTEAPVVAEPKEEVQPVETPQPEVKEEPKQETNKVAETVDVNKVSNVQPTNNVLRTARPTVQVTNPVVSQPQATVQGNEESAEAAKVLQQLNAHRAANGLPALAVNNSLLAGAEVRANEFATKVKSGIPSGMALHTRLDGSSWITAFAGLGARGENLAYSMNGAQGMMNFWKTSASHNAAMLNPNFTSVAIKVVKVGNQYYGVQIFA